MIEDTEDKEKINIQQMIVVEGRDDTAAVKRAVSAGTIETHGFGIKKETWHLLEKAYKEKGLIIFTDPDHAGENIRKRVSEKFPDALHAYLDRSEAESGSDIGIENAQPENIRAALKKARAIVCRESAAGLEDRVVAFSPVFSMEDIRRAGLSGRKDSSKRRAAAGKLLGIGNGNSRAFLNKLNDFGITKEEFNAAISEISAQTDKK